MEYTLCGKGCCPVLKIEGKTVKIGEAGNEVKLKAEEWNAIVKLVKKGEVGEV